MAYFVLDQVKADGREQAAVVQFISDCITHDA